MALKRYGACIMAISNLLKGVNNPFVIGLVYILFGFLWVIYSDRALLALVADADLITTIQSVKGFLFVFLSGGLVFLFVKRNNETITTAQKDLLKKNDKFRSTFEQAPVGIAHYSLEGEWLGINKTFLDLFGYDEKEIKELRFEDLIETEEKPSHYQPLIKNSNDLKLEAQSDKKLPKEKRFIKKNGKTFFGLLTESLVITEEKDSNYSVMIVEDISHRKEFEEELKGLVEEKEVLLMEVHHRVRNNLALMSAFFDLQLMKSEDEKLNEILEDNKSRIKSLAMIHESFAETEKANQINFGDFLNDLIEYVDLKCSTETKKLKIEKQIASIDLNINQAVASGLFCNEIFNEICIYSQKELKDPRLNITLSENDEKVGLYILFNGDFSVFENGETNTFRSEIIETLKSQLEGDLDIYKREEDIYMKFNFIKRDVYGSSSSLKREKKLFKN